MVPRNVVTESRGRSQPGSMQINAATWLQGAVTHVLATFMTKHPIGNDSEAAAQLILYEVARVSHWNNCEY